MVSHEFLINCLITSIYPAWQAGAVRPAGHRPDPGLTFGNPGCRLLFIYLGEFLFLPVILPRFFLLLLLFLFQHSTPDRVSFS